MLVVQCGTRDFQRCWHERHDRWACAHQGLSPVTPTASRSICAARLPWPKLRPLLTGRGLSYELLSGYPRITTRTFALRGARRNRVRPWVPTRPDFRIPPLVDCAGDAHVGEEQERPAALDARRVIDAARYRLAERTRLAFDFESIVDPAQGRRASLCWLGRRRRPAGTCGLAKTEGAEKAERLRRPKS